MGLRERNNAIQDPASFYYRIIKDHWISPDDEWLDLDEVQLETAVAQTRILWKKSTKKNKGEKEPTKPNGKGARERPAREEGATAGRRHRPGSGQPQAGHPSTPRSRSASPRRAPGRPYLHGEERLLRRVREPR